jgi:hypothetical protein
MEFSTQKFSLNFYEKIQNRKHIQNSNKNRLNNYKILVTRRTKISLYFPDFSFSNYKRENIKMYRIHKPSKSFRRRMITKRGNFPGEFSTIKARISKISTASHHSRISKKKIPRKNLFITQKKLQV